jgi:hypothetical protein
MWLGRIYKLGQMWTVIADPDPEAKNQIWIISYTISHQNHHYEHIKYKLYK